MRFEERFDNNKVQVNDSYVIDEVVPNNGLAKISLIEYAKYKYEEQKYNTNEPVSLPTNTVKNTQSIPLYLEEEPVVITVEDWKVVDVVGVSKWKVDYIDKENFKIEVWDIFTFNKYMLKFYSDGKKVNLTYVELLDKEMEVKDIVWTMTQFQELDWNNMDEIETKELKKMVNVNEILKNR